MPEFPNFDHWFPPSQPRERRPAPAYTLRHPTEDDLAALQERLRDWSDQQGSSGPGRAWSRHVAGTSWLAEADVGNRPLGVLLGFTSPDHPDEAVIQRIVVDPEFRRRGIGRALVDPTTGPRSRSSPPSDSCPTPDQAAGSSTGCRRSWIGMGPARTACSWSGRSAVSDPRSAARPNQPLPHVSCFGAG